MKVFSQHLYQARIAAGFGSQSEAAKALGLTQRTYAHYESGRSFPKIELLRKISFEFGAEIDWLIGLKTPTFEQEIRQRNRAMENTHKGIIEPLSRDINQYQEVIDIQRKENNKLKQRIAELEQQLATAQSSTVKGGAPVLDAPSSKPSSPSRRNRAAG